MTNTISNDEREELIALYENATNNISYFKERSLLILGLWSSVFFFCFEKRDLLKTDNVISIYVVLFLALLFLVLLYQQIFISLAKHRDRITKIKDKFSPVFQQCYGDKGPGFGYGDSIVYWSGVVYMCVSFLALWFKWV